MVQNNQQSTMLGKIAAYTEILIKDPGSTIFVSLAETYRKMGLFDDALQILSRGFEKHSDFSPAFIVLGRIYCQQGEFEKSVEAFAKALEFDPDNLSGLVGFARVRILREESKDARRLLLQARALSPADPIINKLLLSLPPVSSNLNAEIEQEPAEKSTSAGSSPLISATLAELYLKQGLADEAVRIYRELSALSPEDLSLRRKIKELEAFSVTASSEIVADSEVSDLTVTHLSDDAGETASEVMSDSEFNQLNDFASEPTDRDSFVLETLNRWLDNIGQRRRNV
ncbi:tetratricopeptide repeat protein [Pelobacter seleniigenes]|uniref:tetratricopeptide repeat protein n=1 Tax=Pelobacter seleniigenes TaxID=407188 RepID=UPI0004A6D7BF|nr:tetratricopeptide repeat protein [Pelobacter seleniigenes]